MTSITTEQIDYFLSRASFNGLKSLYVCYCALKTKKPFKLIDMEKTFSGFSKNYTYGFLVASLSMGLVDFDINKEILTVTTINDYLGSLLESNLKNFAVTLDKNKSDVSLSKFSKVKMVNEVEVYFGYTPAI